jgi:hypothetical protein
MAFKENSFVRHAKMPAWGVGKILKQDDELVWIDFSAGGVKKLKVELAAEHLVVAEVEPTTSRPKEATPRAATSVAARSRSDARCAHCDQLLKRGRAASNGSMKSCPNCSAFEGEHIFYPYPEGFGTSSASGGDPARDHGDCSACRANAHPPHQGGTHCSQLDDTV